jgi:hypothetical protein
MPPKGKHHKKFGRGHRFWGLGYRRPYYNPWYYYDSRPSVVVVDKPAPRPVLYGGVPIFIWLLLAVLILVLILRK